jgi:hypothetical protein
MSETTSTAMEMCANCGVPIISTGDDYTHIPRMEDPRTDCTDPLPARAADGEEMWHMAVWIKPGEAPEVCDRIRELDGVVELYRAYRPGRRP